MEDNENIEREDYNQEFDEIKNINALNRDTQYQDSNLWAVDKLNQKMKDNMAISEAMIDEQPLRTENTPDE